MSISGLFYKGSGAKTAEEGIEHEMSGRIFIALITAGAVLPVSLLLTKLIKLTPDAKDSEVSGDPEVNLQKAKNDTPNSKFVDEDEVESNSKYNTPPVISAFDKAVDSTGLSHSPNDIDEIDLS